MKIPIACPIFHKSTFHVLRKHSIIVMMFSSLDSTLQIKSFCKKHENYIVGIACGYKRFDRLFQGLLTACKASKIVKSFTGIESF